MKCKCTDFTDLIVQYKIVGGVSDMDLQEELITEADLMLELTEKLAVAKESAREDVS